MLEQVVIQAYSKKEDFKDLSGLREEILNDFQYYLDKTIENLEKNGFIVHFAKDSETARKIILKIIREHSETSLVKSKTNVAEEIRLKKFLRDNGINVLETDLGDFLSDLIEFRSGHPVLPLFGIYEEEIISKVSKKVGKNFKSVQEVIDYARNIVLSNIMEHKIGLTGANAISSEGKIFIIENEGNISRVSRMPIHIVLTSIEKINVSDEASLRVCKAQALFGLGKPTAYVNIISGPSQTGDIPGKTIKGMYGAREVHVVLLDNGRSNLLESPLRDVLKCINCGACLYNCPIFNVLLSDYGFEQKGSRGILLQFFQKSSKEIFEKAFYCTGCKYCKTICPVGIDLHNLMMKVREILSKDDLNTEVNKKMKENMVKYGTPSGETVDETKMFCC